MGVHPALVPVRSLLGNVSDVFNAVWVDADVVGKTMYYGRGAGRQATSSAVVADIVDLSLNLVSNCKRRIPPFPQFDEYKGLVDDSDVMSRFYIRLQVQDKPGVLSKISGILGKHGVSLSSVTQKESTSDSIPMIMLTHVSKGTEMLKAADEIAALEEVLEKPVLFRIEDAI